MPLQERTAAGYILLVEDDRGTCELEAQRLEGLGLEIRKAHSAAEARAALAAGKPAMMLLDYSLPDADALEFVAGLKSSGAEAPPFMLVTGRGDEAVAVAAMKAGASDYLVKDGFFLERLPAATLKAIADCNLKTALRASEERFKTLFECGNDAVFVHRLGTEERPGKFIEVNDMACERLGYTREELLRLSPADLEAEGMTESRRAAMEGIINDGRAVFEVTHRTKDGRLIPSEVSARRFNYNGEPHILSVARDITERKRTESEKVLLSETIKASNNEIYIFDDSTYRFKFLNRSALRNLGYSEEEARGLTPLDLKPDLDRAAFEAIVAPLRSGRLPVVTFVTRHRRKNGSLYPVEVHLQYEPENMVFLAVINDITERQKAENALKEKANLLEIAGRVAGFGGWSVDLKSDTCTWSDEVAAIHEEPPGHSPKVAEGINYYAPEWRERITAVYSACAREGKPYDEEMEIITAKGNRRWVRAIGQAERGPDGRIIRVYGSFQDITAKKRSEAAIRESEETFRRLVEHSPDGIFLQLDGRFEYLNPEAVRLFGAESDKALLGRSIYEVFRPDFHATIAGRIKELTKLKKRVPAIEEVCLRLDGTEFPAMVSAVSFESKGKQGAIVTIRDISSRKKMEEELLRSQKIESLGLLAGGIAHDFNNMLTGITANLSLLASKNPPGREILEDALSATRSAQALAAQLLSFSRGGQPVKKKICLEKALREIYALSTSGSRVQQRLEIPEGLWSTQADENQIKQAVNNVLLNGLQAMPAGGTLALKAENCELPEGGIVPLAPGKYLKLSVSDTGIGIPEKYLSNLFDPYFTTKPKGHGLGLAMTWTVIKNHGGHILVESSPGKGTSFEIFLPALGRCLCDSEPKRGGVEKGSGRILLLEDEDIVVRAARRMLAELGYGCEVTSDGAQTLKRYAEERSAGRPFDAVILDLTIPGGMGGKDAGKELRRLYPDAVLLVSSGYSDEPVMAAYKDFGFDAVLPKPYNYEALAEVLAGLIKKK